MRKSEQIKHDLANLSGCQAIWSSLSSPITRLQVARLVQKMMLKKVKRLIHPDLSLSTIRL